MQNEEFKIKKLHGIGKIRFALPLCFLFFCSSFFTLPAEATTRLGMPPNYLTTGSGLVGWWTFDGKDMNSMIADVSGNGKHAYFVPSNSEVSTSTVTGRLGQAIYADNTSIQAPPQSKRIDLFSTATLGDTSTITLWIKPGSLNRQYQALAVNSGGSSGLYLYLSAGTTKLNMYYSSTNHLSNENSTIPYGAWTFVSVVIRNGTGTFYVNGIPNGTFSGYSSTDIKSFMNSSVTTEAYRGAIDDVRIYSRALDLNEIIKLYNLGATTKIGKSPTEVVTDGLIGHWTFDGQDINWATGSATDRSGQGQTLSLIEFSTTTSLVRGRLGQGLKFGGASTRAYLPALYTGTGNHTICAWYNFQGTETFGTTLYSNGKLQIDGNTSRRLGISSDGVASLLTPVDTVVTNTWQHFCVTRDSSGSASWFLSGVFSNSGGSGTPTAGCCNDTIGNHPFNSIPWTGHLDDVRLYNRILRSDEVWRIYNLGATTKFGVSPTLSLTDGLVGYWTYDGKDVNWATGAVTDKSGQGNTGYVRNMSTSTSPVRGKVGQGMSFDGSDDLIRVAPSSSINNMASTSVSFWAYVRGFGGGGRGEIVQKGDLNGANGRGWKIMTYSTNSALQFFMGYNGASALQADAVSNSLDLNTWTHWVVTFSSTTVASTVQFYKNGVLLAHGGGDINGAGGREPDTNLPLGLGNDPNDMGRSFNGISDEIRVYNRILNPDEVQKLYEMGR